MNTEQERIEFEAWAWQRGFDLDGLMLLSKPAKFSRYASPSTQDAWEAYQAGRATLLAERDALRDAVEALLANPSGMYCDGYPEAERKARAALAQGQGGGDAI